MTHRELLAQEGFSERYRGEFSKGNVCVFLFDDHFEVSVSSVDGLAVGGSVEELQYILEAPEFRI